MPTDPTAEQLENRALAVSGSPTIPDVLTSDNLSSGGSLTLPSSPPPTDFRATTQSSLDQLLASFNVATKEEQAQDDLSSQILRSISTLGGEKTRGLELEKEAGLPVQRQELQNVINQLQGLQKEAAAIPLQIQQDFQGLGATRGGVQPIQTARLRENAIKSLGLAAIGQTLQGNVALAESSIQRALDAEFEPEKTKLDLLKQAYDFNKDRLERVDKRRADTLNLLIKERERILEDEKNNKEEIYKIGSVATKYGAPQRVVQQIFSAKSREEAVALASQYLVDPAAKFELESARLDNVLKKAQINKIQRETALLGEMSDSERKAQQELLANAKTAIPLLEDKVSLIGTLKSHPGLETRVGPSRYARQGYLVGIPGLGGFGKSLKATAADATGKGQAFAGGVHQLTAKETLDSLLSLKRAGGTLGALNEGERITLQNAATKLNDWEVKDGKGNGTGYWNISESEFLRELETIQRLANVAVTQARGSLFSSEEDSLLNSALGSQVFNPAF